MIQFMILVAGAGLAPWADEGDLGKKELAALEGVWRFALVEVNGMKQPDVPFETNKIIIAKDGRYLVVQGPRITRGIVKLDPAKSPRHYDVTIASGPIAGTTSPAIYEQEGDTCKLCFSLGAKERPTDFASNPNGGRLFQIIKRETKDLRETLAEVGRKELAGSWQADSYALDGAQASPNDMSKIKLVVDESGKASALREGKVFIASTVSINPILHPAQIEMTYTEGPDQGKTALGIYKIEGDLLTICRSAPGKDRPVEFHSKPGSGLTLMSYKKDKPASK